MNNKFVKLFKKELLNIVRDRKSFFSFIIMSVVLTPLLITGVSLIEKFQSDQIQKEELIISIVDNTNSESSIELIDFLKSKTSLSILDTENPNQELEDQNIKGYLQIDSLGETLSVKYIYNQSSNSSSGSLVKVQPLVEEFNIIKRANILYTLGINESLLNPINFSTITLNEVLEKPAQSSFILFFLPYVILIALIQGAAQFAIELTAGEKEKNTLATTLSINASRMTIGISKISAILILSLFSLVLNVASLTLTFILIPKSLMGGDDVGNIIIGFDKIVQIFIILLPLSFLVSSLLVLIGIYSRNQKEGGLYILPLLLASIFIGLSGQAFDINTSLSLFFIPLVGQVALIKQVLLGDFIFINYLTSFISTTAIFILVLYISVKMFSKEEVIFRQ